MFIRISFHFTKPTADDYILDCCQSHGELEVHSFEELSSHMVGTTNGDPIVVVARFCFPDTNTKQEEYACAYLIGNPESYVAVNIGGGEGLIDTDKDYGVLPLIDFDRDFALYIG